MNSRRTPMDPAGYVVRQALSITPEMGGEFRAARHGDEFVPRKGSFVVSERTTGAAALVPETSVGATPAAVEAVL